MGFKLIVDPITDKTLKATQMMPQKVKKGLRMGAYKVGKQLTDDLKKEMTKKGRSGRRYRIYRGLGGRLLGKPRLHTASAPNELPAVISGDYRKSIDFKVRGASRLEFGAGARGLAKDYAKALETGTSNMAARQPLGRTVKKLENNTKTVLTREINKQIGVK
jgi:hypothetical protein